MAVLTTALNTVFTPAAGDFDVQISSGDVTLLRRNSAAAAWVPVGPKLNGALIVSNPIAGADYMFVATGDAVLSADQ